MNIVHSADGINTAAKNTQSKNGMMLLLKRTMMKEGDRVFTEYGEGVIVGIDLPLSKVWRWLVKIDKPTKHHFLIEQDKSLAFFDNEIKQKENDGD